VDNFRGKTHFQFLFLTFSWKGKITGDYKITKGGVSFDGHKENRFRIKAGQEKKGRGTLLQEVW
jgi:hypothetical protein